MVIVMKSSIFGVGTNDANYSVRPRGGEKRSICRFYSVWYDMIRRCYSDKYHTKRPTYKDCTVCEEWLTFSNFRAWMVAQDWEGKEIDKDILVKGNKVYSPENCVFVDRALNLFTTDHAAGRGGYPIGVHINGDGYIIGQCSNPFSKSRNARLGVYHTTEEAHQAWKKRKHEIACKYADLQSDERVANALRNRYSSDHLNDKSMV